MRFKSWSYRFAEQVLNSKFTIKKEIEEIIKSINFDKDTTRPRLNKKFEKKFIERGWKPQQRVSDELAAKIDFVKERVGVEVAFVHPSFMGLDFLKFQTMSYSNLDKIDIGVYIVITSELRRKYTKFGGSIIFEKVKKYLPHFRSAIQVPIWVVGLEE